MYDTTNGLFLDPNDTRIQVSKADGSWSDHDTGGGQWPTLTSTSATGNTVLNYSGGTFVFVTPQATDTPTPTWFASSSSGPTVTEITVNEPPTGPFNTGTGPDYYLDGEVVSNDTITASDITLYKNFQAYANSNITMYGNHFSLTKSGTAVYTIVCGGQQASLYYQDESWVSSITSNSSSRTNNS